MTTRSTLAALLAASTLVGLASSTARATEEQRRYAAVAFPRKRRKAQWKSETQRRGKS